jgi:hypothetical protein
VVARQRVAYYAGAPFVPLRPKRPEGFLSYFDDHGVSFVIVNAHDVAEYVGLEPLVGVALREVQRVEAEGETAIVWAYGTDQKAAPRGPCRGRLAPAARRARRAPLRSRRPGSRPPAGPERVARPRAQEACRAGAGGAELRRGGGTRGRRSADRSRGRLGRNASDSRPFRGARSRAGSRSDERARRRRPRVEQDRRPRVQSQPPARGPVRIAHVSSAGPFRPEALPRPAIAKNARSGGVVVGWRASRAPRHS